MAKTKKEKKPKSKTRVVLEWVGTGLVAALIVFCAVVLFTTKIQRKNSSNPNAPAKIGNLYFPVLVLSNSMEPDYKVDSAIFIEEQSCESIYKEFTTNYDDSKSGSYEEVFRCSHKIDLTFDDYYRGAITSEEQTFMEAEFPSKNNRTTIYSPMRTMTHRLYYVIKDDNVEYGQGRYHFYVSGINAKGAKAAEDQFQIFTEKQLYGRVTGSSEFVGAIFKFAESPWGLIILLLIPCLYMVISSVIDVIRAYSDDEVTENADTTKKISSEDPLAGLSEKQKKKLKEEMLDNMMKGKDEEKK